MRVIQNKKIRDLENKGEKILRHILLTVISLLIAAPVFIIIYRYVPDLVIDINKESIRLDHILTGIIVFALIRFMVGLIEKFIVLVALGFFLLLSIAHFSGIYTYGNLMHNYQDLVAYVDSNPVKIPFLREERMTIRNAKKIRAAIDYQHPDVRNFAVKSAKNHFSDAHLKREHGRVLLYFSIFKTIRNSWIYIPDPKGEEYYANASETIDHLSGDCDDYSIIMAACIRAVGGDVRLVHTKGHLYPEVKIGKLSELEDIIYLIKRKLFLKESLGGKIYYHIDRNDNVWINFDYTNWYPGGQFMDEKIIGIMVV